MYLKREESGAEVDLKKGVSRASDEVKEAEQPLWCTGDRPGKNPVLSRGLVKPGDGRGELPRKEVIQPHLPVRLPCYDFVPIAGSALDGSLLAVRPPASGVSNFHDVTGGVYKARERIHRCVLTSGY